MIGKVDLVMWAKNGAPMLPTVLRRVEEVIPHEAMNKKIFADDHSTDGSASIAEDFGRLVFFQRKRWNRRAPQFSIPYLRHVLVFCQLYSFLDTICTSSHYIFGERVFLIR